MFSFQRRPGPLALFCAVLLLLTMLLWPMSRQSSSLPAAGDAAVAVSTDNWGLSFPTEGQSPVGNATVEELAQYNAYYLGDASQKVIYLTFDCGYENGYTASILDTLKKHNAPAAFFVVGNMIESAPDLIRRMVAEGHIVGNHTYPTIPICPPSATRPLSRRSWSLWRPLPGDHRPDDAQILPPAPGKIQCEAI